MAERGLFVVLEGVEGSGKSTQARLLDRWLTEAGVPHVCTREPGGTPAGEAVRTILLNRLDLDIPSESELFLLLAARAAFVRDVVAPALARGEVVVSDRFELSTFAYQGYGRGLDMDGVRAANRLATGGLRADLHLFLDVPVSDGMARHRAQGKQEDRIEGAGLDFLERAREGYLRLAESDPDIAVVDGTEAPEDVHRSIVRTLVGRFSETFPEPMV